MQAQKLDNALLSLLGTGRDPRTDHPLFLTDQIAVDVEFHGQPSDADRQAVVRLGGTFRAEWVASGEVATIVATALSVPSLTELPSVVKLHYGGARGGR